MTGLRAGEKTLVKIERNNELVQLAIQATEFKLREQRYVLASIQNIRMELEEKEMEAYQKLIRVLTHEIMNSMTPISSLASSVNDLLKSPERGEPVRVDTDEIREAVQTIEKRSRGLLHFVEAYRNLTRIPKPVFKISKVGELFGQVETLMRMQVPDETVRFTSEVEPANLEVTADPELLEQVLINLLLNAIHAVRQIPDGAVRMKSFLDKQGHVIIDVIDNGTGIPDEVKEKVFIPFFTTKKDGSGIGLSLSKEIMRLHKGSIHVHSQAGEGTVFRLVF
jgi:signal transduction histidine kinase